MDTMDSGIKILSLNVRKEEISWSLSAGGDYRKRLASDNEHLDLSLLNHNIIELLVKQLQLSADIIHIYNVKIDKDAEKTLEKLIEILGELLYNTLFKGEIRHILNSILNEKELKLLRIELEFENPELASWPWEYLRSPLDAKTPKTGHFLATITELVLNRRLSLNTTALRDLKTPKPVNVLLVVSKPIELGEVPCNTILETIRGLKTSNVVDLEELIEGDCSKSEDYQPIATSERFQEFVEKFQPHIIHFIGHGRRTHDGGQVAFVKDGCEADWVKDEEFASWAAKSLNLKLVFLQACESAPPDPQHSVSGMALQLAHQNIPAVVAMQYKVESQVANTFASAFYNALAEGKPVDLAVKAGRQKIGRGFSEDQFLYHAFGLPVLYLSSYESLITEKPLHKEPTDVPRALSLRSPCPSCGTPLALGSKVCGKCGQHFFLCPSCGMPLLQGSELCGVCGQHFFLCPDCGTSLASENKFCGKCGLRLSTATVEARQLLLS